MSQHVNLGAKRCCGRGVFFLVWLEAVLGGDNQGVHVLEAGSERVLRPCSFVDSFHTRGSKRPSGHALSFPLLRRVRGKQC